jgi:SAM-dependent methyltransferase
MIEQPGEPEMDLYNSTRDSWEQIWRDQATLANELSTLTYQRAVQTRALYRPYLPRNELILEAGCGLGREIICLESQGYQVIGVDYAEGPLHQLHAFKNNCRLAAADVHDLPFQASSIGAYLSFGVLEHFEFGPEPGLSEANRILHQDGILVLLIPYPNLIWQLVRLWKRLARRTQQRADFYETTYTVRQLRQHLRRTGFEILDQHPVGHSFTLWGLGGPFRGKGYYQTSALAERLGAIACRVLPWAMCFESLLIARKCASGDKMLSPSSLFLVIK